MSGVFDVQYIKWNDIFEHERPFMLFVDIPKDHADQRKTNVDFEQHETTIHNLREANVQRFNIEAHGFRFRDVSEVAEIHDSQDFDEKYIPIVKDIIRQECSGCDEILITSWRQRNSEDKSTLDEDNGATAGRIDLDNHSEFLLPAGNAHTDTSPMGGLDRVAQTCEKHGITRKIARARIINVWRPIYNAVYDWPLAICDANTIRQDDLVEVTQIYPDSTSSPMFVRHNLEQRWYYVKEQKPSEMWIFKQFDSAEDDKVRFCPHVSFFDPGVSKDAPTRKSVEVRAIVLDYAD